MKETMGLDMYLKAKRTFAPDSKEGQAILKAAGMTFDQFETKSKTDPKEEETSVYLSRWTWEKETPEYARAVATVDAAGLLPFTTEESKGSAIGAFNGGLFVDATCVYWRKANAVHGWFVKKVQGGIDECQEVNVSREQLKELLAQCQLVVTKPTKASEVMPPREGFFFGSSVVDEYYMQDMKHTISEISRVLLLAEKTPDVQFVYRRSW